jgi:hypothetical protein
MAPPLVSHPVPWPRHSDSNPAIIPGVQAKLAEDEDAYVRRALASNPAIVPDVQHILAVDKQLDVRSALVNNSSFWRSRDEVNQ